MYRYRESGSELFLPRCVSIKQVYHLEPCAFTTYNCNIAKMELSVIIICSIVAVLHLGLFAKLGGSVPMLIFDRRGDMQADSDRNIVDLTCSEEGINILSTFWNGDTQLNQLPSSTHTHVLTPDTEAEIACSNQAGVMSPKIGLAALPEEQNFPLRTRYVNRGDEVVLQCDYPPGQLRELYTVRWRFLDQDGLNVIYLPRDLPVDALQSIDEDIFALTVAVEQLEQTGDRFHCIVDVALSTTGSRRFRYNGATIELRVEEPVRIVQEVQDVTVMMGEMASFTCGVVGTNLSLSWEIDDHPYTGCDDPAFCVTNTPGSDPLMVRSTFEVDTETAGLANNTEVVCKASQTDGREVSSTARLIFPAPTPEPSGTPSSSPTTMPTNDPPTTNTDGIDNPVLSEEVQTLIFVLAGIVAFVIVVIIVVICCVCSLRILFKQGKITRDSRVIRNRPLLQRMVSGERYPRINHNDYHDHYEHMDAELGSLPPGSEMPAHFFQPSDVSDQEGIYNLSRGSGGSSVFLPRHTHSVSIPGSQTNLQQPFNRSSYTESESEVYQKLFPNKEGRERIPSQISTQSTGNLSTEVSRVSPAPMTMAMPPRSPNHIPPKITPIPESASPTPLADEILRHVVGCLMHREDCQIPHCPCKDVQKRYRELLTKDATATQEPPKPPPCKHHLHLSLSQQNLGSNEHPHWHLHTKSHIRRTQKPPLLRRRSKSVDLTPIIEMRETPMIEKHLAPTPIDEKRVLRRASFRFQADCDSPDGQEEDPNWRPPLLREISLSADNLPALCLNDCPLTPSPLRENRTLVAVALSPLREQRSRWVHKPKLGTVAENSLSVETSSEDGSNTSSRSVSAASIENEDISKEKSQVEENPSTPKQLRTSTSVPESGYDTNYSDTEGNSDKLSRKHLHHESIGRPRAHTSPQPPPPPPADDADERDTRAPPMPAHLQGHSPTHHRQEYGHSHRQERSPAYLQNYSPTHSQGHSPTHLRGHSPTHLRGHSPTHQSTQHSPTHRYRTSSTGHDARGRSPLQLPEAVVTETLC